MAVTATSGGFIISDSVDVLLDRLWIHDAPEGGLEVVDLGDPTSARLARSLVESVGSDGAYAWQGAELAIEQSVLRDTQPSGQIWGHGVRVRAEPAAERRGELWVRRSLIERNHEAGIRSVGTNVTVEDTVVRDTLPSAADQSLGLGILIIPADEDDYVPSLTLIRSVVAANHTCGVCTINADATVEATVVRGTKPSASDDRMGYGMALTSELPPGSTRPVVAVSSSVVEHSHGIGLAVAALDATVEAVIVRDTEAEVAGGTIGRGLAAEPHPHTQEPAVLALSGSVIERSHEVGLAVIGSEAVIDGTVVRDSRPRPADGLFGRGIIVQLSTETYAPSQATISHSLVEGSHEAGIYVVGSNAVIEDSVIRDSKAQAGTGLFGDGVIAAVMKTLVGGVHDASLRLDRCLIEGSTRAAVATFGALIELGGTQLECNTIAMNGEVIADQPFQLTDLGGNICGCDGQQTDCKVLSSGLWPPDPM